MTATPPASSKTTPKRLPTATLLPFPDQKGPLTPGIISGPLRASDARPFPGKRSEPPTFGGIRVQWGIPRPLRFATANQPTLMLGFRTHTRSASRPPNLCSPFGRYDQRRRRGTSRIGSETSVSPSGLASCRSSAVKASMSSGASKARLRRPTLTWTSTSAATRRSMAWLAA